MTNSFDFVGAAALILAVALAAVLIVLVKKGVLTGATIHEANDLLDTIEIAGDGFTALLYRYARMAVRTVEQLVKNGTLEKDNSVRKAAAMGQIEQYAQTDGVELNEADRQTAADLIEAAVAELP